jgi:hypothetical protein
VGPLGDILEPPSKVVDTGHLNVAFALNFGGGNAEVEASTPTQTLQESTSYRFIIAQRFT